MRLSRDHLWSANAGALGTSVQACQLKATEARGKPLPMLRPGLKSYFEGGGDFAEDSKGKCVHNSCFCVFGLNAVGPVSWLAAIYSPRLPTLKGSGYVRISLLLTVAR